MGTSHRKTVNDGSGSKNKINTFQEGKKQKPNSSFGHWVKRQAQLSFLRSQTMSKISWRHRLNREHPTCTERNDCSSKSANRSMSIATRQREEEGFRRSNRLKNEFT